jgi:hypothetical protein
MKLIEVSVLFHQGRTIYEAAFDVESVVVPHVEGHTEDWHYLQAAETLARELNAQLTGKVADLIEGDRVFEFEWKDKQWIDVKDVTHASSHAEGRKER